MNSLNVSKFYKLEKGVQQLFVTVSTRNQVRGVSSWKFNYKHNGNSQNLRKLMYGIGLSTLYGIWHYGYSKDEVNVIYKKIKSPFIHLAAATSSGHENIVPRRVMFNFLADVVEKTQKSVVYIEINARHPFTGKHIPISNGSGFIIKENGLILTNAHVVHHYGQVIVKLFDGQELPGIVEDIDTESDLATVRIQATELPELPLGCSADVRPGEFVIAMGNPLTLSHTITAGVVSSVNRQGKELGLHEMSDYIQTDAAINVGNSGGPLVNLDGEVIGINSMKVSEGISFAIPSDRAVKFLKRTEEKKHSGVWRSLKRDRGKKQQKFLGITMLSLSPSVIKDLKERNPDFPSVDHGVLVWRVMVGSPSYECGIRPGDVISKVNGSEVYNADFIQSCLEKEDVLNLSVQRGRQTFEISVKLVQPVMP